LIYFIFNIISSEYIIVLIKSLSYILKLALVGICSELILIASFFAVKLIPIGSSCSTIVAGIGFCTSTIDAGILITSVECFLRIIIIRICLWLLMNNFVIKLFNFKYFKGKNYYF